MARTVYLACVKCCAPMEIVESVAVLQSLEGYAVSRANGAARSRWCEQTSRCGQQAGRAGCSRRAGCPSRPFEARNFAHGKEVTGIMLLRRRLRLKSGRKARTQADTGDLFAGSDEGTDQPGNIQGVSVIPHCENYLMSVYA